MIVDGKKFAVSGWVLGAILGLGTQPSPENLYSGWVYRPKPVKPQPEPKILGLGWVLGRDLKIGRVFGSIFKNVWVFGSTFWVWVGSKISGLGDQVCPVFHN